MSASDSASAARVATSSYAEADPQLYAFLDWMEQQDPDYAKAFRAYGEKSTGEGQALAVKYREMVMTGYSGVRRSQGRSRGPSQTGYRTWSHKA